VGFFCLKHRPAFVAGMVSHRIHAAFLCALALLTADW
jgi:hypothetical protein